MGAMIDPGFSKWIVTVIILLTVMDVNAQNNGTEAQSLDARRQSIAAISTVNSLELIDIDAIAFGAKSDVLQLKKS